MTVHDRDAIVPLPAPSTPHLFTDTHAHLLRAICDTFAPPLQQEDDQHGYFGLAASDLGVPQAVAQAIAALPSDDDRAELRLLLRLLGSPALGLALAGRYAPFTALDAEARERFLRSMASSAVPQLRTGFQALKRLTLVHFHALTDTCGRNPTWPALGYDGPLGAPPQAPRPIVPLTIERDTTLDCDVV